MKEHKIEIIKKIKTCGKNCDKKCDFIEMIGGNWSSYTAPQCGYLWIEDSYWKKMIPVTKGEYNRTEECIEQFPKPETVIDKSKYIRFKGDVCANGKCDYFKMKHPQNRCECFNQNLGWGGVETNQRCDACKEKYK